MIKKSGTKYTLFNKAGTKKLGESRSKKGIIKRERQVQFFKHLRDNLKKR